MRIARHFGLERALLGLVLIGAFASFSGCGGEDKNAQPAAEPQPQAQQDAEREAREKAMSKK